MPSPLRRLYPEPAVDTGVEDFYHDHRRRVGDRPWVMVTMVASLDGTTVVDGTSGGLGNATDAAAFSATRAAADVLLVGAGTVRAEGYGPPRISGLRVGVVTRSGQVDPTTPLFTSGAGFLVVPETAPTHGLPAIQAGRDQVDLPTALRSIDTMAPGAVVIGCEGGPHLNAALADAGCIDELNLTTSPRIAGGDGRRLVHGAGPMRFDFDLVALAVDADGFVFSRWVRRS